MHKRKKKSLLPKLQLFYLYLTGNVVNWMPFWKMFPTWILLCSASWIHELQDYIVLWHDLVDILLVKGSNKTGLVPKCNAVSSYFSCTSEQRKEGLCRTIQLYGSLLKPFSKYIKNLNLILKWLGAPAYCPLVTTWKVQYYIHGEEVHHFLKR